jgi:hypothetical protein
MEYPIGFGKLPFALVSCYLRSVVRVLSATHQSNQAIHPRIPCYVCEGCLQGGDDGVPRFKGMVQSSNQRPALDEYLPLQSSLKILLRQRKPCSEGKQEKSMRHCSFASGMAATRKRVI